ncbi:hypothetical protein SUGI_0873970, partial [Cryptomeria japonica]
HGLALKTWIREYRRNNLLRMLNLETPPSVCASMERGVATTVASSTTLTEEGLVTPDHERAPIVDEHHDYLYAVELQESLHHIHLHPLDRQRYLVICFLPNE